LDTVVDNGTGLEWERVVPQVDLTREAATARCKDLGRGFRVPSLAELFSIYNSPVFERQLDSAFPSSSLSAVFWTTDFKITDKNESLLLIESIGIGMPLSLIPKGLMEAEALLGADIAEPLRLVRCVR
jgi:hypothetical protein